MFVKCRCPRGDKLCMCGCNRSGPWDCGMTLGTVSIVTWVRIWLVYMCPGLSFCCVSPQQTVDDPKSEVVVLSDRSQILFKESRHPQNMPLICYYFSDANFFASLSWVTATTKEIQVKLPRLPPSQPILQETCPWKLLPPMTKENICLKWKWPGSRIPPSSFVQLQYPCWIDFMVPPKVGQD